MKKVVDETRTTHRTMRDLVALSALPAVWAGYQPRQIAEGLADAMLSTLGLDLVYLRLPGQATGQEIEVARTAGRPTTTNETRNIGRALAPFLDGGTADLAPSILNPAGDGTVRLVIVRIGYDSIPPPAPKAMPDPPPSTASAAAVDSAAAEEAMEVEVAAEMYWRLPRGCSCVLHAGNTCKPMPSMLPDLGGECPTSAKITRI